jgi:hypothetical protein
MTGFILNNSGQPSYLSLVQPSVKCKNLQTVLNQSKEMTIKYGCGSQLIM